MYRECRHIKDDGQRCHSPAMKSKPYCYFHTKLKRMDSQPMIHIPMLEDSTSVLLGIGQVMRMLALDTMEIKRAGIMLYGLQIATCVIKQRAQARPEEYVRSVHDEAGNDIDLSQAMIRETPALAPENIVCEPPHDCAQCEQKTNCEKLSKVQKDAVENEFCNKGRASESAEEFTLKQLCNNGTASAGPYTAQKHTAGLQPLPQIRAEKPGAPSKPMPDTSCPNTLAAAWVGNIEPPLHSTPTKRAPGAPSKPLPETPHSNTLPSAWVGNIEPSPHSRRTKRTSQTGDLALSHPIDTTPSPHTLRKIAEASLQ